VLIEAIRGEEALSTVRTSIDRIASTVDSVVAGADRGSSEPSSYQAEWRQQTGPIQDNLHQYRNQLVKARNDSQAYDNHPEARQFTQTLPPLAFQIARETRELVRRIQGIRLGGGDDDFS